MVVTHRSTKFGANIFIHSGDINISLNLIWRPPPFYIITACEFDTKRQDAILVIELCTDCICLLKYYS